MDRRPLKVRGAKWAKHFAAKLSQLGVTPNAISILSVVFGALVLGTGYLAGKNSLFFILSALLIQLRLICNLLDGMVAVEHGKSMPNGELFNDVPDRFADIFILMGGALSISSGDFQISPLTIGWIGSLLAVITAYVRVLGRSLGTQSYFIGPMAKQHRMFLMTIAFVAEFFLSNQSVAGGAVYLALIIIAVGSFYTVFRRLSLISSDLMAQGRS